MFQAPFTMIISGATGSGKTQWLWRFLQFVDQMVEPPPANILYCYGEMNETILKLKNQGIQIHNGLPTEEMVRQVQLVVLDDLMLNFVGRNNDFLDLLFTRGSHNWGVSVVFVTQSLFGRDIKTARANAHYLILMRNPSAQLQVRNVGSQLFPKRLNYFLEAYRDATADKFSYLLVNMHPNSEEHLRLSTNIFPVEQTTIYLPI